MLAPSFRFLYLRGAGLSALQFALSAFLCMFEVTGAVAGHRFLDLAAFRSTATVEVAGHRFLDLANKKVTLA